jgi:rhamnosyltransferase
MKDKSIDILLPTYNGEKYIGEQIESIINQTYKNWRLLIRDDGSVDGTVGIIKKYIKKDKRIELIEDNLGNLGLVKNIEKLMKESKADYIMFADQDDVWLNNKIEIFIKELEKEKGNIPILIHSDCYIANEKLEILRKFKKTTPLKNGLNNILFTYWVQGSSSMINKKLKEKMIPFLEEVYIHDRYAHLIVELFGKRVYINKCTMYYRQHDNNLIGNKNFIEKIIRNIRNIKRNKFFHEEDRELIMAIKDKFKIKNKIIEDYLYITDLNNPKLKRLYLLLKNKFLLRLKEKILFIFN